MSILDLFRRETIDEIRVAANAAHFDGVDTFTDPKTGLLGLVAVHQGRRVCQQCGGGFDESNPKLRLQPVYMYPDAPPIGLHAKCEVPPIRIFRMFQGLATRRHYANIVKQSAGLDKAAASTETGIRKAG